MMMPHSTFQRDLTLARRERHERPPRRERAGMDAAPDPRVRAVSAVRIQIGRALIGAGSWLSGERVEKVRPSAQRAS